ncbi:MAG: aldehyde ferredoxin oxidoreductase family protein [Chloroflexi bacterium]|nr:aldehyde ferredoxin oxidoreductase family protein [Chloroflexota bacterium]
MNGYNGKILHVHLDTGTLEMEQPDEMFYRRYMGGSAMGMYYLLKNTPAGADPLGPENTLSLMLSVITGAPVAGQSRVTATAKSPETGLVGDSQAGGFWPAEMKRAGFDGIVFHGKSPKPVYLWVHNGEAELRDAAGLKGKFTGEVEETIRNELGDNRIEVLQCGPAAEKGVLFGALLNMLNRANGRTGMGTVMASKNVRAVAVRGGKLPPSADPQAVKELAKWGAENFESSDVAGLGMLGTAEVLKGQNDTGTLPTRNWDGGFFDRADLINGKTLYDTVLKERDTCYACVVRCKRVVEITNGPYKVDPRYGGPEYETLATMGSYCDINNLPAICYANQLCNMYGMDTIACGATIAWAMDCFEHGYLTLDMTGGIDLRFGNADAMVKMVEMIGKREGLGYILGQGSTRAAEQLGFGKELLITTKKHEFPAHMPQVKRTLALIYAVNPFGADHQSHEHDPAYGTYLSRMAEIGLYDPKPDDSLDIDKVRYAYYTQILYSCLDSLNLCQFVWGPAWQLFSSGQMTQFVHAVTGWETSLWELMKVGERRLNMMRAYNSREGVGKEADTLPAKMFIPLKGGASDGVFVTVEEFEQAKCWYYQMAGWDENGHPTRAKLDELAIGWIHDA